MRIGITYNLKDELYPAALLNKEYNEEFDTAQTIDAICDIFVKNGFEAVRLGGNIDIIEKLRREKIDFVFNIAEGYFGRNRESHIPSILEMLNIPYSGSDPLTLGLTLDKTVAKKIALNSEILTPAYQIVREIEDMAGAEDRLRYPMITKPVCEGSSKGIYNSSKVFNRAELEVSVKSLFKRYPNQHVLVEEYITGQEITAGMIGNDPPQVLGVMEIANKHNPGGDFFYSLEAKRDWQNSVEYILPPNISPTIDSKIRHYAFTAFREFGCKDIARLDFRVSEHSDIFLLEINPLPGLSPESGDIVIMAQRLGIGYEGLIMDIFYHALSRYGLTAKRKRQLKAV